MEEKKENGTQEEEGCLGPLEEDCENCPKLEIFIMRLNWDARIPQFIIDLYLRHLSPSAWKVFCFLNRMSNFDSNSNHFGRCWPTYKQIEEGTGVKASNMAKYIKELKGFNLVTHSISVVGSETGPKTVHLFTVTWRKRMRRLNELAERKEKIRKKNTS